MLPYCKSYSMSNQHYLRIEIESLQCVDDQGVLCEPIIHDHVEAVQERRSLYNGLVVGIVQTLEPKEDKCTWLKSCRQNETDVKQSKGRVTEGGRDKEKRSEKDSRQTLNITLQHTAQTEETLSRWLPLTAHLVTHCRGDGRKNILFAYDYTFSVISHKGMKPAPHVKYHQLLQL